MGPHGRSVYLCRDIYGHDTATTCATTRNINDCRSLHIVAVPILIGHHMAPLCNGQIVARRGRHHTLDMGSKRLYAHKLRRSNFATKHVAANRFVDFMCHLLDHCHYFTQKHLGSKKKSLNLRD